MHLSFFRIFRILKVVLKKSEYRVNENRLFSFTPWEVAFMIKAVLFDMDGILFDTEIVMKEGWQKAARELNFTLTEEHLSQMRGSALPRSRKLFEEWFHGQVTYDEGRAIRTAYLNDYIRRNGVPEKPGLHEFLSWLKEHSIKVAVATSTTRRVAEDYWKQSGIDQYINASVCGDEVINSKPDPEIFLKAASLLKVPIAACIVAEDSINGLKAARAAGAISCMIPDLTPYTKELFPFCDYVSPSLLDCKEILLQTPEADKLKSWK